MLRFPIQIQNELIREGITCFRSDESVVVPEVDFETDFCYCGFECDSTLRVFSGSNDREKDYFTLYYKSQDVDSTITYYVGEIELVDEIHGESIDNGFIVDWTKISNELGYKNYCLRIVVNEFGFEREITRGDFTLLPFSLEEAQSTVRFKTNLNGQIENEFDYEDENVPFEIRLPAEMILSNRIDERERFLDRNREDTDIHVRWFYEYEVKIILNNIKLIKLLLDRYLVGNEITIDSYNLFKPSNNQTFKYMSTEIEDIFNSRYYDLTLKFEDFKKDKIKHPYLG